MIKEKIKPFLQIHKEKKIKALPPKHTYLQLDPKMWSAEKYCLLDNFHQDNSISLVKDDTQCPLCRCFYSLPRSRQRPTLSLGAAAWGTRAAQAGAGGTATAATPGSAPERRWTAHMVWRRAVSL